MLRWALISLCFIAHYYVSSGQDRVEQSYREMPASEGDQLILKCNYTTTDPNPYLFWYKQLPNRSPTFILSEFSFGKGTTEPEFEERFSATLDSKSRSVPLKIQDISSAEVSDSAVYYCALRPTVTGNTRTLYKNLTQLKYPGSAPEFLVLISDSAKDAQKSGVDSRFITKIRKEKQNYMYLEISSAALKDSAVYYCALQPTVTGNTITLYKNLLQLWVRNQWSSTVWEKFDP
ncbi:T cell receptor alpha chain MC.7.G5-like [Siphateles boraxobius]|uniref:T cell receptor alpha chain MC.7.G5-like n=1 Tax=Siphateles boraxobius TaxID=180520 RepID=UPI004064871C